MIFSGRLAKESMSYDDGKYIKDLSYLNRDLRRVVVIELDPSVLKYHSENGIYIPKF